MPRDSLSSAATLSASLPPTPSLVRVQLGGARRLCLSDGERVIDLTTFRGGKFANLDRLVTMPLADVRTSLEAALRARLPEVDPDTATVLAPTESQEVWAAGVTYARSREARMEEAAEKDIYARVYAARRPEIFFKATGWRVVASGGRVGIRSDSTWTVPEPELAVFSNSRAEVLGYACGNDMSSRSLEGENPLYLPQAKVYTDSCAIGPVIALAWHLDPSDLTITLGIQRDAQVIFRGQSSTANLVRDPGDLVKVVYSTYALPRGAWLLTGAGIVPPSSYSAVEDDVFQIRIEGVGELVNTAYVVAHSGAEARTMIDKPAGLSI